MTQTSRPIEADEDMTQPLRPVAPVVEDLTSAPAPVAARAAAPTPARPSVPTTIRTRPNAARPCFMDEGGGPGNIGAAAVPVVPAPPDGHEDFTTTMVALTGATETPVVATPVATARPHRFFLNELTLEISEVEIVRSHVTHYEVCSVGHQQDGWTLPASQLHLDRVTAAHQAADVIRTAKWNAEEQLVRNAKILDNARKLMSEFRIRSDGVAVTG